MRASFSPQSEPRPSLGISSSSRSGNPLSRPLYATCSPGDSGHTDLPSPSPSSCLTQAVPTECFISGEMNRNCQQGSRSFPDRRSAFWECLRNFSTNSMNSFEVSITSFPSMNLARKPRSSRSICSFSDALAR